ncbi:hypothetical protein [Alloyangia pacifica]|nr:hypothetical protein [Alloyangia pacifica]MCA0998228.1 hypothetical protein [Alloyangia pacifica]
MTGEEDWLQGAADALPQGRTEPIPLKNSACLKGWPLIQFGCGSLR